MPAKTISSLTLLLFLISPLHADKKTVIIQNESLSVALSSIGAELQSIRHKPTKTEYLWQGDPKFWDGRSPNMFPVNVRFKDEQYSYRGRRYEMPRMGLAINGTFETIESAGDSATQRMGSTPENLQYYPFPFELSVTSKVHGLQLDQIYTVSNKGSETMYFALGGHPGFRTPHIHGRNRSDYELVFSETLETHRDEVVDSLLTGKRIPFLDKENRLTQNDARVPNGGMFLLNNRARQMGVALKGRSPYVTVNLVDFPHTNIWTPPGMPFICIEPMLGHHDRLETPLAIEEKDYLIALPAGESKTYRYAITIHPEEGVRALKQ